MATKTGEDKEEAARWERFRSSLLVLGMGLALVAIAVLSLPDVRRREAALAHGSRAATLGTLAMGITHELAMPLGIIAARTEQILARLPAEDRIARSIQVIIRPRPAGGTCAEIVLPQAEERATYGD